MGEGVEHDEHNELSLKKSSFINQKQHLILSYNRFLWRVKKIEKFRMTRCLKEGKGSYGGYNISSWMLFVSSRFHNSKERRREIILISWWLVVVAIVGRVVIPSIGSNKTTFSLSSQAVEVLFMWDIVLIVWSFIYALHSWFHISPLLAWW